MRLSSLVAGLPLSSLERRGADPEITLVTDDSRQVQPGALFVAISGESVDGRRFIPEALARGAVAVAAEGDVRGHLGQADENALGLLSVPDARVALGWLSAAWHGFPSRRLVLIGVTGTDGKTTTANLIYAILQAAGLKAGMISTVNAVIGDEMVDTGFHVTTPDAPAIQSYLARMANAGLDYCVLEVTSHGLAQHRVAGCEFDIAVITNITHEHLDYHKSFENYRAAKRRLFEMLSQSSPKHAGSLGNAEVVKTGVLNGDDPSYPYLAAAVSGKRWVYSALEPSAAAAQGPTPDVWASGVTYSPASMQFTAVSQVFSVPIVTPLVGSYNVSNCLAALATTVAALGVPQAAAQKALAGFAGVPGRMERIDLGQPFTALVDFAHTPNALKRSLEAARQMTAGGAGRVIVVFGSAGLRDVEKRRLMAEVSAELADISILTAEDPRTESLEAILESMAAGARARGAVEQPPDALVTTGAGAFYRVPDRGEALRLAVRLARPGDLVMACGKGHEQSMCFGAIEYPWDDRTAMRAALAERLGLPGPAMPRLPTSQPAA